MDAAGANTNTNGNLIGLTAGIVSAYVTKNAIRTADIPELISAVHSALKDVGQPSQATEAKLEPAVSIKKSVTPDYLVSLFDGKRYKSLKRYLRVQHNMTPEQYRMHWGLAPDYPMVAPNYSQTRSALAKAAGLGQQAVGRRKGSRSRKSKKAA
jgi:predicted transcriptional regulator